MAFVAYVAASFAQPAPKDPTATEIRQILDELGKLMSLKPKSQVPFIRMTRDELRKFAESRLDTLIPPAEIAQEQAILRRFGLIPKEYDLRGGVLDMVSEQAAALYDEEKKRMVLLDLDGNEMLERIALVHELAHALADQHYDLGTYLRDKRKELNDDEQLARSAAVEGQATWLMMEHTLSRMGQSLRSNSAMADMMGTMASAQAAQMAGMEKAPLYLREQLIFPYTEGMKFQQAVAVKMTEGAFSTPFTRPPASTQQILHPELYFSNLKPAPLRLPKRFYPAGYKVETTGTLGEFDHRILFQEYGVADPKTLAAAWRGSTFEWVSKGNAFLLVHLTRWENAERAQAAGVGFLQAIKGKSQRFDQASQAAGRTCGTTEEGRFIVLVQGDQVLTVEGIPQQNSDKALRCEALRLGMR